MPIFCLFFFFSLSSSLSFLSFLLSIFIMLLLMPFHIIIVSYIIVNIYQGHFDISCRHVPSSFMPCRQHKNIHIEYTSDIIHCLFYACRHGVQRYATSSELHFAITRYMPLASPHISSFIRHARASQRHISSRYILSAISPEPSRPPRLYYASHCPRAISDRALTILLLFRHIVNMLSTSSCHFH